MTGQPNYTQAITFALDRLRSELSPKLTYHNLWHTVDEVLPGSARIAQLTGVSEDDLHLLEVAAAFHDIGFTEAYANHEIVGARIVAQVLPNYGFDPQQIERIMGMIIATRLPQSPRNLLEEILADADLDTLGREDFLSRNEALRQEWVNYGRETPLEQWYEEQLAFLKTHRYFTPAARMLRNEMKKKHFTLMEEKLQAMNSK
ncbi:MAG TPA: HD domain-containing protein [Anaerolineales bacterium]|nr:HD domain-containing protein [Anaerolineales bacterium]